ncbi:MAG TPA: hypothetical protein VM487_07895 [Phycisphaerae bacterium]|nr:hypothetical protein [Phycisphaerae bacterium]
MPSSARTGPFPDDPKAAIVDILVRRVRVLSAAQVARTWCRKVKNPQDAARRLLRSLERDDLVECVTLMARPEIIPDRPLVTWQSDLPRPDFGPVAWQLQNRRQDQVPLATLCVVAASARHPRPTDTTHDLHLAAVYLLMCKELPTRARSWVFETDLIRAGEKLPDAMVTDGKAKTVIECGGEYDRRRLEEDHEFFARMGYGYEVW